jgi:hypothetical protein
MLHTIAAGPLSFLCFVRIRYHGKVFTEPLVINGLFHLFSFYCPQALKRNRK